MKNNNRKIPTEFGPETRFELSTLSAVPFKAAEENRLEGLKSRLLKAQLEETWEPELNSAIRRAANEAASLAWVTPYPLLVFPVLFEEKAAAVLLQAERQEQVRQRSRELLAV